MDKIVKISSNLCFFCSSFVCITYCFVAVNLATFYISLTICYFYFIYIISLLEIFVTLKIISLNDYDFEVSLFIRHP